MDDKRIYSDPMLADTSGQLAVQAINGFSIHSSAINANVTMAHTIKVGPVTIHQDGRVEAHSVEAASEAGKAFVDSIREEIKSMLRGSGQ